MTLEPRVPRELKETRAQLDAEGRLTNRARLETYYATFRQRFGPERLQSLDGEALLREIHDYGPDSLVYWLEFKNDEELPNIFGSIAGGSALKFGLYRRRETGAWMTGNPRDQRELTTAEAIEVARRHRDELVRGAALLDRLPPRASDEEYAQLQADLDREAPPSARWPGTTSISACSIRTRLMISTCQPSSAFI